MARRRDDDDDDRISDRPRSGGRRDDDDEGDLPRRRRRRRDEDDDDYDDERPRRRRGGEMGPLDGMYRDTNIVVLVLFALCCNGIAFILSLIAVVTAKDPTAKSNATVCMIVAIVVTVLGVGGRIALMMSAPGGLR
jgi:hypothetical protein